jgi:hypothetical protein
VKSLLAVFVLLLAVACAPAAHAGHVHGIAPVNLNCLMGTAYPDGCPAAPLGVAPQHPTLFASEATRPPWNVAGVDYGVGFPMPILGYITNDGTTNTLHVASNAGRAVAVGQSISDASANPQLIPDSFIVCSGSGSTWVVSDGSSCSGGDLLTIGNSSAPIRMATLLDPTIATLPAPFTYYAAGKRVNCYGTSNAPQLVGYDFSLHGGTAFYDASCGTAGVDFTGPVLIGNYFKITASNCVSDLIDVIAGASGGITFSMNVVDGGSSACPSNAEIVSVLNSGTSTNHYNWFKNIAQHDITHGGASAAVVWIADDKYNLKERFGWAQGKHTNGVETVGGAGSGGWQYETSISGQPSYALSSDGVNTNNQATAQNGNQFNITSGVLYTNPTSFAAGMIVTSSCLSGPDAIATLPNNAAAPSGGRVLTLTTNYTVASGTVCNFDIINAYPFGMVFPYHIVTQLYADATLTNISESHNVVISTGPINTVSYDVSCSQGAPGGPTTSVQNPIIVSNYLDSTAAVAPFYSAPGFCDPTAPATFGTMVTTGNMNMVTGLPLIYPPATPAHP